MAKVRILDVGSGPESVAAQMFAHIEDKEIVRLDIDPENKPDIVHDIAAPLPTELIGAFDLVVAFHVLEHLDRAAVIRAFKSLADCLRNRGEVWVGVPSLEFACDQILAHNEGMHIQQILHGRQVGIWDYHRCSFTLRALRQMVEVSGLIVKKAYQATFVVGEHEALQNIVIGAKYDLGPEDAI